MLECGHTRRKLGRGIGPDIFAGEEDLESLGQLGKMESLHREKESERRVSSRRSSDPNELRYSGAFMWCRDETAAASASGSGGRSGLTAPAPPYRIAAKPQPAGNPDGRIHGRRYAGGKDSGGTRLFADGPGSRDWEYYLQSDDDDGSFGGTGNAGLAGRDGTILCRSRRRIWKLDVCCCCSRHVWISGLCPIWRL